MKKEEIHFGDFNRWLYGLTPPQFMIEVAIRTVLIYLILLLVVRFLGKRMSGQVTLVELSVMMTLGAIVSPVMQIPDRGIIFGAIVLIVALVFQRGLNLWAVRNEKIEHRLLKQGVDSILQQYATVAAVTRDRIVYLQGSLTGNKLQPLTDAINSLKPKTVENKLVIK